MSTKRAAGRVRTSYEFIKANRKQHSVQEMCRVLGVAPSGYYDWLKQPLSKRSQEDARLLTLVRASFVASHGIYGAPRVFLDLREAGETCSKHRVARLMHVTHLDRTELADLIEANTPIPGVPFYDVRSFIVSFCKEQNSAVHWLHYGRSGTGVAIRFRTGGLARIDRFTLAPAIYSAETRRLLFDGIVQRVDELLGEWAPRAVDLDLLRWTLVQEMAVFLKIAAPQLKDGAFAAENEWRLFSSEVFRPGTGSEDGTGPTIFRSTPTRIVPYKDIEFDEHAIEEVVLGHSCPLQAHKQALEVLMEQCLGRTIPIRQSGVPVRP